MRAWLVIWGLAIATSASAAPADDWLTSLGDRVIGDVAAGKPLVIEVHVPLCESSIIACGNAKLGDGDNPATNLYWATTPGFGEWFARKGSGWKRIDAAAPDGDVLAQLAYQRDVAAPAAWVKRGAPKHFAIELVIHGC